MIKAKSQDQPDMGGRVILFGRPASSGGEPGEVAVGGGAPPPCRGGREGGDGEGKEEEVVGGRVGGWIMNEKKHKGRADIY